ncbi:unnamed protein product [Staurois parvus]|uniref:non-specific serine/threonine protein kinase n=1 Tax=Staurois parvus TaxID=386267 RepID=A0ABN9BBG9_9NEOB|nr:unnamed protein product [Staurois parvus]
MVHKRNPIDDNPDTVLNERQALEMAEGSPFCSHAYAAFQTEDYYLFYVMDYLRGGDVYDAFETLGIANNLKPADLSMIRILSAELLCGLKHLHSRGVVHRDLKIDNILVDTRFKMPIRCVSNQVFGSNM